MGAVRISSSATSFDHPNNPKSLEHQPISEIKIKFIREHASYIIIKGKVFLSNFLV
jgi:hypothetical protein